MTGIGNTIETDLVGELIVVCHPYVWHPSVPNPHGAQTTEMHERASGRCRAVTCTHDGKLILWLEVIEGFGTLGKYPSDSDKGATIGDVIRVEVIGSAILRLVRPK